MAMLGGIMHAAGSRIFETGWAFIAGEKIR
jgi:hypothetical protein